MQIVTPTSIVKDRLAVLESDKHEGRATLFQLEGAKRTLREKQFTLEAMQRTLQDKQSALDDEQRKKLSTLEAERCALVLQREASDAEVAAASKALVEARSAPDRCDVVTMQRTYDDVFARYRLICAKVDAAFSAIGAAGNEFKTNSEHFERTIAPISANLKMASDEIISVDAEVKVINKQINEINKEVRGLTLRLVLLKQSEAFAASVALRFIYPRYCVWRHGHYRYTANQVRFRRIFFAFTVEGVSPHRLPRQLFQACSRRLSNLLSAVLVLISRRQK